MLGLWVGLKIWAVEHTDDCDRYVAGDGSKPDAVEVRSGTRKIVVPCNVWVARQPVGVQVVFLVEMAVGVVFVVSGVGDWMRWWEAEGGIAMKTLRLGTLLVIALGALSLPTAI